MKKIQKGNQIDELLAYFDKPFLYVDFNEFIDVDLMLLCQSDQKKDIHGDPVELWEGLAVVGYQEDEDRDGRRDDLWVEGVCVPNLTGACPHVKWLLRLDSSGVQNVSDWHRGYAKLMAKLTVQGLKVSYGKD